MENADLSPVRYLLPDLFEVLQGKGAGGAGGREAVEDNI